MANADFTAHLTQKTHCPVYVFEDFIAIYSGADNDPYEAVDLTAEKTAVMAVVAAQLATLESTYSIPNGDIVIARDAILASLNAQITDTYSVNKSDVLEEVGADYKAAIEAERTVPCPKCKISGEGVGRYPADGPGGSDPVRVPCETCDTFGNVTTVTSGLVVVEYPTDSTEFTT